MTIEVVPGLHIATCAPVLEKSEVCETSVPKRTGSANQLMMNLTRILLAAAAGCIPLGAHASFLSPEKLDVAAFYLAWFIIIVFPIAGTILFLMIHMLPEKIAERRHHPQKEAIKTLTILSLIFGGMLWPICWLWAYVRPTNYRAIYGTTKHEDYYYEMGEKARAGKLSEDELAQLREEIDAMADTGTLPLKLKLLRKELDVAQAAPVVPAAAQTPPAGSGSKAGGA